MSTETICYLVLSLFFAGYYLYLRSHKGKDIDRSILRLRHRYDFYRRHKGELLLDDYSLFLSYLSYLFRLSSWKGKRDLVIILFVIISWIYDSLLVYRLEDVASVVLVALLISAVLPIGLGYSTTLGRRTLHERGAHLNKGVAYIWAMLFFQNIQAELFPGNIIFLFLSGISIFQGMRYVSSALYKPSREALDKATICRNIPICREMEDDLLF